jgi:hypothetical protein
VNLLAAVTNHVAIALETARASQLELAVQVAQRERDTAEVLRRAMTSLTESLDPATVVQRLASTVAAQLPRTTVFVVYPNADGRLAVVATRRPDAPEVDEDSWVPADGEPPGGPTDGAPGQLVDPVQDQALAGFLGADGPRRDSYGATAPLPGLLPTDSTAWLAVPLALRGEVRGVLVAATPARPYTDADLELAAAPECRHRPVAAQQPQRSARRRACRGCCPGVVQPGHRRWSHRPGTSPAHRVAKPRRLPNARRALAPDELEQINLVARTSGNDVILDAVARSGLPDLLRCSNGSVSQFDAAALMAGRVASPVYRIRYRARAKLANSSTMVV